jgi:hypothetical protein
VDAATLLRRENGDGALLSWEEIEALARTGLLDFQSHTLLHARVHTGPQLAGFVTPDRAGATTPSTSRSSGTAPATSSARRRPSAPRS